MVLIERWKLKAHLLGQLDTASVMNCVSKWFVHWIYRSADWRWALRAAKNQAHWVKEKENGQLEKLPCGTERLGERIVLTCSFVWFNRCWADSSRQKSQTCRQNKDLPTGVPPHRLIIHKTTEVLLSDTAWAHGSAPCHMTEPMAQQAFLSDVESSAALSADRIWGLGSSDANVSFSGCQISVGHSLHCWSGDAPTGSGWWEEAAPLWAGSPSENLS